MHFYQLTWFDFLAATCTAYIVVGFFILVIILVNAYRDAKRENRLGQIVSEAEQFSPGYIVRPFIVLIIVLLTVFALLILFYTRNESGDYDE